VRPEYLLQDHDVVGHYIHRHEPPVAAQQIDIVHDDDDILVIDKPASVPIHPTCGSFILKAIF
jgi:23S rRNA-/tRNA-specific pseudouridylate synthase